MNYHFSLHNRPIDFQRGERINRFTNRSTEINRSLPDSHDAFDKIYTKREKNLDYYKVRLQYIRVQGNFETRRTISQDFLREIQDKNRFGSYLTTSTNVEVVTNLGDCNIPQRIQLMNGKEKITVTRYIIKQDQKMVKPVNNVSKYNLLTAGSFISGGNGVCEGSSTQISTN